VTRLHIAAKERDKEAIKLLIENGAFIPPDTEDHRFNPPLQHYCPGLEWAYDIKHILEKSCHLSTNTETSHSSPEKNRFLSSCLRSKSFW
jgi:hypothetical protein